jgi:LmbE family N-acetylglucosaminyl deacetylase
MVGTEGNVAPGAFCTVDVEEAAARLAGLLQDEGADALVAYDDHGGYGHPDHIQVHHVGLRAADLAGTPALYQATISRDAVVRFMALAAEAGVEPPADGDGPTEEEMATLGLPDSEITTVVDVRGFVLAKRAAMACHETQVGDMAFFLGLPLDVFGATFGQEWYLRMRAPEGTPDDHLV